MKHAFKPYARVAWRVRLFQCLMAMGLTACGGGGGAGGSDAAVNESQANLDTASTMQVNGWIQAVPSAAATYDVVILEAAPPVSAAATASAASINATGQVAFTSSRADGRHALFYDGQTIRDLGLGYAAAINNAGQVAGGTDATATSPAHALRWSTAGRATADVIDLGTPLGSSSTAQAINVAGQVAGTVSRGDPNVVGQFSSHPFLWTEGVGMLDLSTLALPDLLPVSASHVNARGLVAGSASIPSGNLEGPHAFLWTPGSGLRDLGTLGGSYSFAKALNDDGQVAGTAEIQRGRILYRYGAFLWSATGGMRDLGTLGGRNSDAFALNALGQVAGASDTRLVDPFTSLDINPWAHAFFWSPSGPNPGRMLDLGTFGGLTSLASAINDSGQVVGKAATDPASPNLSHAFVWTATGSLVDLNTRIPTAPAGLTVTDAIAISQNGTILARTFGGLVLLTPSGNSFASARLSLASPPGAYRPYPGLAGSATFSAQVRSGKTGQKPTGQTRFHLARNLHFESTGYDWLNVQAGRAQYQGSGALNGSDGYQFRVTLIDGAKDGADGAADRLRIRIWHADTAHGANVVDYDNQLDASTEGTANEGTASQSGYATVHVRQAGKAQEHAGH